MGVILARAGASEEVVVAGILHDTIEDSHADHKVTKEILTKRFGRDVAALVDSVTEQNKELSWEDRKREALKHVEAFSHESLMLKSADIIANTSEIIEDHRKDGNATFDRFNAPKEKILQNYQHMITAIIERWPNNPLVLDLREIAFQLTVISR